MTDASPPTAIILAGSNGAGKTTSSRTLLAKLLEVMSFVNADAIAQGLSGFDPEGVAFEASRIMLERLHALAEKREDFAFETTLAARTYAPWIRQLRENGYAVHLFYFWLTSPDLAVARVAERVRLGGHHIPEQTIRQRYVRSLKNLFALYRPRVTTWQAFNNTYGPPPRPIASGNSEGEVTIIDEESWNAMRRWAEHE
jgi:predicted ABC-type ATPase